MTGIYIFLLMLILPIIAQINVTSTFNKYSKVRSSRGLTADQVARQILDSNGLYNVRIERVSGKLSDHYDPRDNVVRLSDSTYGNSSVAAIGVAAHECASTLKTTVLSYSGANSFRSRISAHVSGISHLFLVLFSVSFQLAHPLFTHLLSCLRRSLFSSL